MRVHSPSLAPLNSSLGDEGLMTSLVNLGDELKPVWLILLIPLFSEICPTRESIHFLLFYMKILQGCAQMGGPIDVTVILVIE